MVTNVESLEADVIDLTHDGQGVADIDGRRVFVPGALTGERIRIRPRRRRRQFQEAELLEVITPAQSRVEPPCPYFGRCGGCAVQHLSYGAQVEFKQKVVQDAFERIAGLTPSNWLQPMTGPEWYYRRRARLGVRYVAGKNRVLVGFKERSTRYVTDMLSCRVIERPLDRLPGQLAELIGRTSLKQRLPQAEVSVGENARAVVLRVLDEPNEDDLEAFENFGIDNDIDIYLQRGGPGTVEPLTSKSVGRLSYRLPAFGVSLTFAPTDFVQVNSAINEQLVAKVVEFLDVTATDRVLDLYCGLGNFSLPLARHAASVLGVEGDAGLVARAAQNARDNNLGNASFVAADLSEPEWSFLREEWDLVVLDPSRSGALAPVSQMSRMRPRKIAYVSCHPATLARDAKELVESQDYRLTTAGIADMFPHTHHVEAMALFERR